MFERFTTGARTVVVRAQEEARQLRAERIEPVHLLLALAADTGRGGAALGAVGIEPAGLYEAVTRSADPLDADALAALGVDLDQVRSVAEAAFGPGALDRGRSTVSGHMPFAEGSKRALEQSLRHAVRHGRRRGLEIDSGNVLAGVLAVDDPTVERVLRALGADCDALRERVDGPSAA